MAGLATAKQELRRSIQSKLTKLTTQEVEAQSQRVLATICSLPEYKAAQRISVYLSMPSGEIDTTSIIRRAFLDKKTVYVPYIYKSHLYNVQQRTAIMDMVSLHSIEDMESLKRDKWGIPTLAASSIVNRRNCMTEGEAGLDLIIMPGVAFDQNLNRLGHGKGFYDFFLQRYHHVKEQDTSTKDGSKISFLIGLALKQQFIARDERVPVDDTDWPLHGLIIGDGSFIRGTSS